MMSITVVIVLALSTALYPFGFWMMGYCAKIPVRHITCNVEKDSVTCNFQQDMNTDKRPINVVRYPASASPKNPGHDLLLCQWEDSKNTYDCEPEKGFSVVGNITKHLKLRLSDGSANFSGLYKCFIMQAKDTQSNACELFVKENAGKPTGNLTQGGRNTDDAQQKENAGKPTGNLTQGGRNTDDAQQKDEINLLWLIVIPVFMVFVGLVVAFICRHKRQQTGQKHPGYVDERPLMHKSNRTSPEANPIHTDSNMTSPEANPIHTDSTRTSPEANPIHTDSNMTSPEANPIHTDSTRTSPEANPIHTDSNRTSPEANPIHTDSNRTSPKANPIHTDSNGTSPEANPIHTDSNRTSPEANPIHTDSNRTSPKANPIHTDSNRTSPEANPIHTDSNRTSPEANPIHTDSNRTSPEANPIHTDSNGTSPEANPIHTDSNGTYPEANPLHTDSNRTSPKANPIHTDSNGTSPEANPIHTDSNGTSPEIEAELKDLLLSKEKLDHVMELLHKEIRASLEEDNTRACPVSVTRLLTRSGATRKLTSGHFAHLSAEGQTQTSQTCVLKPEESGVAFVSATLNVKNVESLQAHCFFSGSTIGQQVAEQETGLKEGEVTLSVKSDDIKPVDKVVIEAKGPANSPIPPSVTVKEVTGIAEPTGAILVVNLSSMKLFLHLVRLQDPGSKSWCLESRNKDRKGKELFDYIAKSVGDFAKKHKLKQKKFRLAFVFSFPCTYESNFSNARLTKWTGEIDCDRVVGENLKELFQEALQRNKVSDTIKVVTVVNDAVCMLVDAAYGDPNCKIAVHLMDGFTACYRPVQINQATEHSERNIMQTELTTTNIGALGAGSSLEQIETHFDRSLDEDSLHSGQQTLEKMVSIMYIGELVRLVLVHLAKKHLLFKTSPDNIQQLNKKNCLGTEEVSLIEGDTKELTFTKYVLKNKLQMDSYDEEDCQTVRYVCKTVSKRAADLAAAGVATLINLLDVPEVSVAIEVPIKESHPEFLKHLEERARELVNPKLNRFKIVASKHGIRNGAALLVAAVSPSFPNTAPTMVPSSASS